MAFKNSNSNNVTLKHRALFLIFRWSSFNHWLFRYIIEMEEHTKIAQDLDGSIKVGNRVYLAKRVQIISASKAKNASSKFFCKSQQLQLNEGRAPTRVTACWRCFLPPPCKQPSKAKVATMYIYFKHWLAVLLLELSDLQCLHVG